MWLSVTLNNHVVCVISEMESNDIHTALVIANVAWYFTCVHLSTLPLYIGTTLRLYSPLLYFIVLKNCCAGVDPHSVSGNEWSASEMDCTGYISWQYLLLVSQAIDYSKSEWCVRSVPFNWFFIISTVPHLSEIRVTYTGLRYPLIQYGTVSVPALLLLILLLLLQPLLAM